MAQLWEVVMDFIAEHWELGLAALLALASIITRITPTPKDDQALATVRRALGRLSILEPSDTGKTLKLPLRQTQPEIHPDDLNPPPPEQSSR